MGNQGYLASFFVDLRPGTVSRIIFGGTRRREIVWKGGSRPYATIITARKDRNPVVTLERATRAATLEFWVNMLNTIRPDEGRRAVFRSEVVIQNAAAQIALSYGPTLLPSFIERRIRILEASDLTLAREACAIPMSRSFGSTPRLSAVLFAADQLIREAARH